MFSLSKFKCFERIERAVDDVREDVVLLTVWYGVDRMLEDRLGGCCRAAGEYYTEAGCLEWVWVLFIVVVDDDDDDDDYKDHLASLSSPGRLSWSFESN